MGVLLLMVMVKMANVGRITNMKMPVPLKMPSRAMHNHQRIICHYDHLLNVKLCENI